MRVAIVHDWLVVYGGAERVLAEILALYPEADLYSTVDFLPPAARHFLGGRTPRTSFIQKLPLARSSYRNYLFLMPMAVEQFDLSGYDLVISSSYAVAKGVITGPHQTHVCYIHSPIRYAWDLQASYLKESKLERGFKSGIARAILHYVRMWDVRTSHGVDCFVANSRFVARRVKKVYGRHAEVIYPPVDTAMFIGGRAKGDFYVTASRLVQYKRVGMIVEAFNDMPDRKLVVIGDGPEYEAIKAMAKSNVFVLGHQPAQELVKYLAEARAFVFAAEDDFGIAPVEAQASGTPVIALGKGGALETVNARPGANRTGVLFDDPAPSSIIDAVKRFEAVEGQISPEACRNNALRFAPDVFRREFKARVDFELERATFGPTRPPADIVLKTLTPRTQAEIEQ